MCYKFNIYNHIAELGNRLSKSGGSEDIIPLGGNHLQLNALNLQTSAPVIGDLNGYRPSQRLSTGRMSRPNWMSEENSTNKISFVNQTIKRNPPRILEALPLYPQGTNGAFKNKSISERISDKLSSRFIQNEVNDNHSTLVEHARSPMY